MIRPVYSILLLMASVFMACVSRGSSDSAVATDRPVVAFDVDSAMSYLKAQTDFGPRVPGTGSHRQCADWLVGKLTETGADTVVEYTSTVEAWNGDKLPLRSIMARYGSRPGVAPVLLMAHWDSRPWADAETDPSKASTPIDGANDGASGVAVLLEIARQAGLNGVTFPLEIMLIDGEDYGSHDDHGDETSWCLGTQSWLAGDPYCDTLRPRWAILLDMVGGEGARFHREYISDSYAPGIVDMVWNAAAALGLGDRFVNERGGAVVDDHLFLNRAGIPAIDIIESMNPTTGSFNPTWHTLRDTFDNIDRAAIGDTGRLVSFLTISPKQ